MICIVSTAVLGFALLASAVVAQGINRPETVKDTAALLLDRVEATGMFDDVRLRPDLGVEALNDGEVEQTFFPENLHKVLRGVDDPEERAVALDAHLGAIMEVAGGAAPELSAGTLDRVYPVVRHESLGRGTPGAEDLLRHPFVSDLAIFYVLDSPRSTQYISIEGVKQARLAEGDVLSAATANLSRLTRQVQIDADTVSFLVLDGYYESSLLLDQSLRRVLAIETPDLVAIVPSRDLVAFADGGDPRLRAFLREQAKRIVDEAAGPVSGRLLVWTDDGWAVE